MDMQKSSGASTGQDAFVFTMVWLFPIVCIAGVFVNFSNLAVVIRCSRLFNQSARIFIASICAINGATLLIKGPVHYLECLARFNLTWWPYRSESIGGTSEAVCRAYYALTFLALVGAPYYQLGLTLDRVLSVLRPLSNRQAMSLAGVCATMTVLSLVAASIGTFGAFVVKFEPGKCGNNNTPAFEAFRLYEFLVGRVLLLACMLLGSAIVLLAIHRPSMFVACLPSLDVLSAGGQQAAVSNGRQQSNRKATLILLMLNGTYLLCSLPAGIYVAARTADPQLVHRIGGQTHNLIHMLLNTLMYLDFCINGCTLFVSQRFRAAFVATIGLRRTSCCCAAASVGPADGSRRKNSSCSEVSDLPAPAQEAPVAGRRGGW